MKRKKKDKAQYLIQSVSNALNVLESFIKQGELGITEISEELDKPKNNVFRLLSTLAVRGYIDQNPKTGSYKLGSNILNLSKAFLESNGVIRVAGPILQDLVEQVNENSYFGILRNHKIFYVEHAESSQTLRVASRIGTMLSPLCTAIGKVIYAFSDEKTKEAILANNEFQSHTKNTVTDQRMFDKQIAAIQKQYYTVDYEELDEGVRCVGAPIFNYDKEVVGGISISGPATRLTDEKLKSIFIPKITDYSRKISQAIGYKE